MLAETHGLKALFNQTGAPVSAMGRAIRISIRHTLNSSPPQACPLHSWNLPSGLFPAPRLLSHALRAPSEIQEARKRKVERKERAANGLRALKLSGLN